MDGTGNLTISVKLTAANLQITIGATAGQVLTSDASGNATRQVAGSGSVTASNGLTATSGNITLGGTLTAATVITGSVANRLHLLMDKI